MKPSAQKIPNTFKRDAAKKRGPLHLTGIQSSYLVLLLTYPYTTYCIFILLTSSFPRNKKGSAFIWSMTEERRLVEEEGSSSKKTWWQKKEDAAERVSSSPGPLPASSRLHLPPSHPRTWNIVPASTRCCRLHLCVLISCISV